MASIDSKEASNVEVQNEAEASTSKVIPTNNDQNPNTRTAAEIDAEIVSSIASSELFAYDPEKYSFCKEKSIVNLLKTGEAGALEFQAEIKEGVYGITIWPESTDDDYENLLDEMDVVIPEANQWSNRCPKVGELVFGQRLDGDWIRGYIVSVLPNLKLAMIDEAKLVLVSNLASCNKPLSDMYAFSGVCTLSDTTHVFMDGDGAQFKVTGRTVNGEPNEFDILIINKDFEVKATVKPWIPMPEQLGVPCGEITNGCEVCITGYRNHMYLYARPLDALGMARYNFIMDTVAKCAENSPFLENPDVARTALAKASDGHYYRGYITRVEKDKVQMMYHDLGRREYADRKTLKVYPEYLKNLGYSMAKIYLKDIPRNIPPFMPIVNILDNLVETQVPLVCSYAGIPTVEGVYLKHPNGETVNRMICKTLEVPEEASVEGSN